MESFSMKKAQWNLSQLTSEIPEDNKLKENSL
jgi:hypothetical protein